LSNQLPGDKNNREKYILCGRFNQVVGMNNVFISGNDESIPAAVKFVKFIQAAAWLSRNRCARGCIESLQADGTDNGSDRAYPNKPAMAWLTNSTFTGNLPSCPRVLSLQIKAAV
jgi:hypothetical protein